MFLKTWDRPRTRQWQEPGSVPKRLRRAGHAPGSPRNSIVVSLVELGRQHLRAHALVAALHCRGVLALALGRGLLVELARAKLGEKARLFDGALAAAERHIERL